jgi:hypothetical protein
MSSSPVDANKAVVRRYVDEVQVSGREDVAAELLAADFLHHGGPEWGRSLPGPDSAVMFARHLRGAFSDLEAVIHQQVGRVTSSSRERRFGAPTSPNCSGSRRVARRS